MTALTSSCFSEKYSTRQGRSKLLLSLWPSCPYLPRVKWTPFSDRPYLLFPPGKKPAHRLQCKATPANPLVFCEARKLHDQANLGVPQKTVAVTHLVLTTTYVKMVRGPSFICVTLSLLSSSTSGFICSHPKGRHMAFRSSHEAPTPSSLCGFCHLLYVQVLSPLVESQNLFYLPQPQV